MEIKESFNRSEEKARAATEGGYKVAKTDKS